MTESRLFCFGLGYTARALARIVAAEGGHVRGTARSAERCVVLRQEGFAAWQCSEVEPLPLEALAGVTHLLLSVPPEEGGDDPIWREYAKNIAALPELKWIGYLSSTSVYGDTGGAWVDESSPLAPLPGRAERRADAERAWLSLWQERSLPVHCFRLSGIYGPGRNALDQVRSGTARRIVKEGQVFSRIHVEDAAAVLRASMRIPTPGSVYNVADDVPAPPWEVVEYACALLDAPLPKMENFETATLSPMSRSFYEACRRVSNRKIKERLGVRLRYPDYRTGLKALKETA